MSDEEIIEKFEKIFDEADVNHSERINSQQFYPLYKQLMDDNSINQKKSDIIFRGIDIGETGTISKTEFMQLVKAEVYNDELSQYKLIFRAFDKERLGSLTTDSIVLIGDFTGKKMTKGEAEAVLYNETGSKEGKMTFPVFYKMMTGNDIDPKVDPYDGKLKPNSSCCLII